MSWRSLREARRYVLTALLLELALAPLGRLRGRLLLAVTLGCALFFRDPRRELVADSDTLYAPADGVVADVERVSEPWLGPGEAVRVGIFLALYDVHVNRSPTAGRIALAEERGGGFAPAFLRRASGNHRKRLAIDGGGRRVVVVQVAGMLARRISSWVWLGDRVTAGQRIGLIHFGSRVEVLAPVREVRPLVRAGQRVRAGVTPIGRYVTAAEAP